MRLFCGETKGMNIKNSEYNKFQIVVFKCIVKI